MDVLWSYTINEMNPREKELNHRGTEELTFKRLPFLRAHQKIYGCLWFKCRLHKDDAILNQVHF